MSGITDTIGSTLRKTGEVVADAGKSASNAVSDTYNKTTSSGGGSKTKHVNFGSNSGYSQDAKTLKRDIERMKDNAMADADRRF